MHTNGEGLSKLLCLWNPVKDEHPELFVGRYKWKKREDIVNRSSNFTF